MRPAKIQISLRIRGIWSESSPGAFSIAKDAKSPYVKNEINDQTARMRRLIWVFVGRICQKVRFRTFLLICVLTSSDRKERKLLGFKDRSQSCTKTTLFKLKIGMYEKSHGKKKS